ncbi:sodium/glutamate symporter [Myroides marinus]|uniref:sodium/glutamate symporter n=1 Tax=Myroides marinus TaxID=703342 RepID=UPI0025783B19|nr:sodium/glutamate symporter [Myroides marinus]MDM1501165.1 sodium/glutamate symporter [Myroides marinus]
MEFDIYETLMLACFVLLLGHFVVQKVNFFQKFNIPEPVVGGFIIAMFSWLIFSVSGKEFTISESLQQGMMFIFFSSIGLNADFRTLLKGGKGLIIFLVVAAVFIICQNFLGVGLAHLLELDPRFGLIAGSITLTGGHGTAGGWADTFMASSNPLIGARDIGMACATFGLILGGTIGGPLAYKLLRQNKYEELSPEEIQNNDETHEISVPQASSGKKVNYKSIMLTITLLSVCLVTGQYLAEWNAQYRFTLPTFVWCLFIGVIIRNTLPHLFKVKMHDESIEILGNAGLSIFLACALMSLKMWTITELALPILLILLIQVMMMLAFAYFVTYRVMGKDYDAIVLSAGHCGFGLGATATAVANIQAVTNRFGPSYKAFLIIPMVGAFFIDILNALILNVFITFI